MINRIFLFLFIIVLLGGTVTAVETLAEQIPSFQFNTEIDLKRACFNNGFFCDNTFVCNITIVKPDGALMVENQAMTNQSSYFNITIDQGDNNQLGNANAIMSCNNVTTGGPETFIIEITGDGKPFRVFPTQFVGIIFAFFMITIGLVMDRLRMFKHVGSMLAMVMGVITLFPGYNFINHSTLFGLSLGIILIGSGFYFLIEDSFSRDKQEDKYESRSEFVEDFDD